MRNSEAVRPVEVVAEEVDHVIDEGARTDVVEWVELIGVMIEQCGVVLDVVDKGETPVMEKVAKRILPELQRRQAGVEVTHVAADTRV